MGMFPGSREVGGVPLTAWCGPPRARAAESRHGQTAWGGRAAQGGSAPAVGPVGAVLGTQLPSKSLGMSPACCPGAG